jgi:hypothetical protein
VPAVLKFLLQEGFIDGSCLTVTGATTARLPPRACQCPTMLTGLVAGTESAGDDGACV